MPLADLHLQWPTDSQLLELVIEAPFANLDDTPNCPETGSRVKQYLQERPELSQSSVAAGLWLLAGQLDRSHEISQNILSKEGSFWHGIVHCRESDYWNAKYWFRKTTGHPVHQQLAELLAPQVSALKPEYSIQSRTLTDDRQLQASETVARRLVELVEIASTKQTDLVLTVRQICWWQWQLLMVHCLRQFS
jgi:hypothetical protein